MQAATYQEITQAQAVLTSAGFYSFKHWLNGHLVVTDPVYVSSTGGKLLRDGDNLVAVRTLSEAVRFVNDRS